MTNKLHNRTLFVAALSVYFGLLVVGAPPQVLAQTAKTVGNKNNVQSLVGQNLYGEALSNLVVELGKLSKKKKFDWNQETIYDSDYYTIGDDNFPVAEGSSRNVNNEQLRLLFDAANEKIVRDFLKIESAFLDESSWRGIFKLSIKVDKSGLTVSVEPAQDKYRENSNRENITDFADAYTHFFEQEKTVRQNETVGVIYKNTQVLGEKSNFQIITRLPRAALNSLVKANEKAN